MHPLKHIHAQTSYRQQKNSGAAAFLEKEKGTNSSKKAALTLVVILQ